MIRWHTWKTYCAADGAFKARFLTLLALLNCWVKILTLDTWLSYARVIDQFEIFRVQTLGTIISQITTQFTLLTTLNAIFIIRVKEKARIAYFGYQTLIAGSLINIVLLTWSACGGIRLALFAWVGAQFASQTILI